MEDTRVTFETAKLAKEKGFDALCYDAFNSIGNLYSNGWCEYLYDNKVEIPFRSGVLESQDILAPTQSLLTKWLREEYNIIVLVDYEGIDGYYYKFYSYKEGNKNYDASYKNYNTYEEALEAGLQVALKLI